MVTYFRYLRFFPNGMALSRVSNQKLTEEQISRLLQKEVEGTIQGEYCVGQGMVHCKLVRGHELFNMSLRITSDMGVALELALFKLCLVDESRLEQVLFKHSKDTTSKEYRWVSFNFQDQGEERWLQRSALLSSN